MIGPREREREGRLAVVGVVVNTSFKTSNVRIASLPAAYFPLYGINNIFPRTFLGPQALHTMAVLRFTNFALKALLLSSAGCGHYVNVIIHKVEGERKGSDWFIDSCWTPSIYRSPYFRIIEALPFPSLLLSSKYYVKGYQHKIFRL